MRVFIQTLGCKVNQYETQAIETLLTQRGHTVVGRPEDCDVCVTNTCAVTAESGRKSRQAIRRAQKSNPAAKTAVCGCFSQLSPEEIRALGADLVAGSGDRQQFVLDLESLFEGAPAGHPMDDPLKRRSFEPLPAGGLSQRTRAMLKVQDGCSNFCAYCIIPYARGPVRSLPLAEAVRQATDLQCRGYREIVITGIEIASYGRDLRDGTALADLVCAVAEAAPDVRLRLGSLEPRIVTDDFCGRLRGLPGLCAHFHLSLQSGCDETLRRMNRKYTTAQFLESVSWLRGSFPGCGLTTDLIVGFPGETEAEFAETLSFLDACAFSAAHIFPYSRRPGTAADGMKGQLTAAVKQERARRAKVVTDKTRDAFLKSCIGTRQRVLFETEQDGRFSGHADNYCEVSVIGTNLHNHVSEVLISGVKNGILLGNIIV